MVTRRSIDGVQRMSQQDSARTAPDREEIDAVHRAHVAAVNRGDADAWVNTFAEDGVQMPPHAPANVGREAIRSWARGFCDAFHAQFALSVEEVRTAGDWAFERGAYTIALTAKAGGEPMQETGKYITIYEKRSGGAWKIVRDIWNNDTPPQSPR